MHQFSRFFGVLLTVAIFLISLPLNALAQRPTFSPPISVATPPRFPYSVRGLSCTNPGVENGDFTGLWQGSQAKNGFFGLTTFNQVALPNPNRAEIRTTGFDPVINTLPMVHEGDFSIQLGNTSVGADADRLVYTFTVDESNKKFSFCYALVMQNPSDHAQIQKPFFQYKVTNANGNSIADRLIYPNNSAPFIVMPAAVYKDWECVCLDLSKYIGQTLQIEFTVADCNLSGHYGYAYIDGVCQNPADLIGQPSFSLEKETYCLNKAITASQVSLPKNTTGSGWWIEDWGADGKSAVPGTKKSKYFSSPETIDIKSLYESLGGQWKYNNFYRITLGISTDCVPWKEMSKMIKISCAESAFLNPYIPNSLLNVRSQILHPFTFKVTADANGCSLIKPGQFIAESR